MATRPIIAASLCLTLFALGCSSMNFGGNVSKSAGSASSGEKSKGSAPSSPENSDGDSSGDAKLPEEALAPVIVGGGYLTCNPSEEEGTVDCYIPRADGSAETLPKNVDVSFQFFPNDGSPAIPLDYRREDSASGTIFLIQLNDLSSGAIGGSMTLDGKTGEWIFAVNTIDESEDAEAFELLDMPFFDNREFGDGNISGVDNFCFESDVEATNSSTGGLQFTVDSPTKDVFIMIMGVCGLQTFQTTVTLNGPAPMKPQTARLNPNFTDAVLFHLDLAPGSYQILIDNSAALLPGGTQDDFTIRGFRFTSSLQQDSSLSGTVYSP